MPNILSIKYAFVYCVITLLVTTSMGGEGATQVDLDPFGFSGAGTLSMSNDILDHGPVIAQVALSNDEISVVFQIISNATGWSIFPTAEVNNAKVSLWAKDITAMELLDTVVMLAGFIYHREGDIIAVMTYDEYMQHYGLAKKVIPLTYADAASVLTVIKPFLTKLGKSVVHPQTNTIILYDADANLEIIGGIIENLDTSAENVVIEVISLQYADCATLADILQKVFAEKGKSAKNRSPEIAEATPATQPKETKDAERDTVQDTTVPHEQVGIYAVRHANQLVVVGTKSDIQNIRDLVAKIDVYGDNMVLEVIDVEYADAELLAETLGRVFSDRESKGNLPGTQRSTRSSDSSDERITKPKTADESMLFSPESEVGVYAVGRTNQLIIRAFRGDVERLKTLVEKLDTYVEPTTRSYHFVYVDVAEIYAGLERILDVSGRYSTLGRSGEASRQGGGIRGGLTVVEKTNSILLTGPPSVHRVMASISKSIDVPGTYETGMIRVYKIENADVDEIAATVQDLIQSRVKQERKPGEPKFEASPEGAAGTPEPANLAKTEEFVPQIEAKVSVNKGTNSIVVQATTRQHRELEKLIEELDRRRKQVLIEAMIIEVTTKDNRDLGIELNRVSGDSHLFTSFGLSTIDTVTGVREIIVSPGGTAAILRPDKVQAILKALQSNSDVRIESVPRILVNDNAVGTILSIAEEPTTQTNQGETTTTTSFAGFVEAGTQFAITPHISETDYLRVEYKITLNSFGTRTSDPSIPPPRNTSSIQSEATVPDGHTIVVGGLQSSNESKSVDKIPLLGDIPLLGLAFKNTITKKRYTTTYLFITTTIIKNEDFGDLKSISEEALKKVEKDENDQTLDTETGNTE